MKRVQLLLLPVMVYSWMVMKGAASQMGCWVCCCQSTRKLKLLSKSKTCTSIG